MGTDHDHRSTKKEEIERQESGIISHVLIGLEICNVDAIDHITSFPIEDLGL